MRLAAAYKSFSLVSYNPFWSVISSIIPVPDHSDAG